MELIKELEIKALTGRKIWIKLDSKYKFSKNRFAILLPSENAIDNFYALAFLNSFMIHYKLSEVVLLTYDKAVVKSVALFTDKAVQIEWTTKEEIEALLQFYCLYEFTDCFIIASLDEPNGRTGRGFLKKNNLTFEEIFGICVYNEQDINGIVIPYYNGKDADILRLFSGRIKSLK